MRAQLRCTPMQELAIYQEILEKIVNQNNN
jgi:hypothetical protein